MSLTWVSVCVFCALQVGGEFEAKLPSGEKSALEIAKWKAGAGYGTTAFFASVLAAKGASLHPFMRLL